MAHELHVRSRTREGLGLRRSFIDYVGLLAPLRLSMSHRTLVIGYSTDSRRKLGLKGTLKRVDKAAPFRPGRARTLLPFALFSPTRPERFLHSKCRLKPSLMHFGEK